MRIVECRAGLCVVLLLVGAVAAACSSDSPQRPALESELETAAPKPSVGVPDDARVPDTLFEIHECDAPLPVASACEWAAQADAVVLARVSALFPVDRPAMWLTEKGEWRIADNCPYANIALTIGLVVDRTLSGDVEGDIVLQVGVDQVNRFVPLPVRGEENGGEPGTIQWMPSWLEGRGPLRIGQRVLVGMHRIEQGWSLMGDTILGVGSDGTVYAPPRKSDCLSTDPVEVNGLHIDAVAARLLCSPDLRDIQKRREMRELYYGNATFTYAAMCIGSMPGAEVDLGSSGGDGHEMTIPVSP